MDVTEFVNSIPGLADDPLVTCDECDATDESGWGDTPLCLDCQRKDDPDLVCEEHQRTFEDTCPLDHAE